MPSLNKVQLIGNLGKDPEVRYYPDGTPTVTVSLATTDTWKDRETGERREATEWHRVVFRRGLAEIVGEYLIAGSTIYVEGKNKTRKYEKNGVDYYVTEVIAAELIMLGGKRKDRADAPPEGQRHQDTGGSDFPPLDDDVPF